MPAPLNDLDETDLLWEIVDGAWGSWSSNAGQMLAAAARLQELGVDPQKKNAVLDSSIRSQDQLGGARG